MSDTRILLRLLTDYRESLQRHLTQLRSEYQTLEAQWNSFGPEYEGDGADQYKAGWARTASRFNEYIDRSTQILFLLEDRITRLEKLNTQEGTIS